MPASPTTATSSSSVRRAAGPTTALRAGHPGSTRRHGRACGSAELRSQAPSMKVLVPAHRAAQHGRQRTTGVGVRSGAGGAGDRRRAAGCDGGRVRGERARSSRCSKPTRPTSSSTSARRRSAGPISSPRRGAPRVAGRAFHRFGQRTLALCRRKDRAASVMASAGVAVPRDGRFPCIVKPADEDGSAGSTGVRLRAERAGARGRAGRAGRDEEFLPGRSSPWRSGAGDTPKHVDREKR